MSSHPAARPAPSFLSPGRWVPCVLIAAFVLLPIHAVAMDNAFMLALMSRIVILAIAAVALNLVLGYGGMVSFGHALFLGLGVYSAAIPAFHGVHNGFAHLLIALAACGLTGLVTGAIALRTQGIAFIMITLAFAQMFYFVFVSLSPYGGDDGLRLAAGSRLGGASLADAAPLYAVSLAVLFAALYATRRLAASRFGMALRGSRVNDRRMRALGFPTFRYRLAAYVISAMLCGVAGVLYANLTQFASPSYMSWAMSGELIVMVVLGGMGSVLGPLYGAAAMLVTEEILKSVTEHWMIIFGPAIVAVAVLSRRGIAGLLAGQGLPGGGGGSGAAIRPSGSAAGSLAPALPAARLSVRNLVKRYGGLLATDDVSLDLETGRIHAVIGPNGAGKSTLIGQLSGEIAPDSGAIQFDGRDITRLPVHARSLLGLMRSYQITSVFAEFTALENVMLAVQAQQGHSFRFWRPASRQASLREPALAAMKEAGLEAHADTPAGVLAHGQQRQLELAMVLAGEPRILLLDEPMAGMSQAESQQMTEVLSRLRPRYAILLVEHDMDAVFSLADQVSVLVYGRCIATGTPADIRRDAAVQQAYLGDEE
ncbi:branched-chain amino acid ABC transporter ATP-binding protein/permease [Alcaligenaceae bacterium]|nr:branched-chain amino acid ABC transporter ATP-binding protein/permease [Alcaligenaceae bacterium]